MREPLTDQNITGGCACGQLHYKLKRRPLFVHCCHCTRCQRETGSAYALNALIESTEIAVLRGHTESITIPTLSGKGQRVIGCRECKTVTWSHYAGAGEKISFVRVGTLDSPALYPPDIHIYTATRLPFVEFSDNVSAVPQFYSKSAYWSKEGLARYEHALSLT